MANDYKIGNDFLLRIDNAGTANYIVCEQTTELSVSSELITVLCKNTGPWATNLAGGLKSGSISFTGAYLKDPTSPSLSAFELLALVGTIQSMVYGGTVAGDDIVEVEAHVTDLSISSNTNEAITFSATFTLADEPVITTVPT